MKNKNVLIIPIWLLYNVESIDEVKFDNVLVENIKEYDLEKRRYLYSVLESVTEESDFDEVISNSPTSQKINFSNEEIYDYLMNFKDFMLKERLNS